MMKGARYPFIAVALAALAGLVAAPAVFAAPKARPAARPLPGTTYDYRYDGGAHPDRAWLGRAYVPASLENQPSRAAPLVVFMHGLNRDLIPYRWMGGGSEGDVRAIIDAMVQRGDIEPVIVAAPSSIVSSAVSNATTSWPSFDLENFIARSAGALEGRASIDRARVVVVGHSGAGCNDSGGIAAAAASGVPLRAILSIDTCMGEGLARRLGAASPETDVVVSWQSISWSSRPFDAFKRAFQSAGARTGADDMPIRALDFEQPREPAAHNAMVHLTLEKWLPKVIPAAGSAASGK